MMMHAINSQYYIILYYFVGEIHTYDHHGSPIGKVSNLCLVNFSGPALLAGIRWYHPRSPHSGGTEPQRPSLAVCFQSGRVQLMQNDQDPVPIVLDTGRSTP